MLTWSSGNWFDKAWKFLENVSHIWVTWPDVPAISRFHLLTACIGISVAWKMAAYFLLSVWCCRSLVLIFRSFRASFTAIPGVLNECGRLSCLKLLSSPLVMLIFLVIFLFPLQSSDLCCTGIHDILWIFCFVGFSFFFHFLSKFAKPFLLFNVTRENYL